MTNNIKEIEKRIEKFLNKSLEKKKYFKNETTFNFIEGWFNDFFIFNYNFFNTDSLSKKRNEINYILELLIINEKYNEFEVETLNCLVNFIDEYIKILLLQEKE